MNDELTKIKQAFLDAEETGYFDILKLNAEKEEAKEKYSSYAKRNRKPQKR